MQHQFEYLIEESSDLSDKIIIFEETRERKKSIIN